uniref:Vacuolar ATPase assembly protein VMA22 n=2 Tax=Rhizophora mucronata TaxID=61149 RepID=A0A2P2L6T3_RHIMU
MGTSRVNTALLDLTSHSASTWLKVTALDHQAEQPHFALRKWGSLENDHCCNEEHLSKESMLPEKSGNYVIRRRANSLPSEERDTMDGDTLKVDDQVQKERGKWLSVFGTLVSPKLRAAQLSFETALEMLVEIANMRSAILSTYDQIHK